MVKISTGMDKPDARTQILAMLQETEGREVRIRIPFELYFPSDRRYVAARDVSWVLTLGPDPVPTLEQVEGLIEALKMYVVALGTLGVDKTIEVLSQAMETFGDGQFAALQVETATPDETPEPDEK